MMQNSRHKSPDGGINGKFVDKVIGLYDKPFADRAKINKQIKEIANNVDSDKKKFKTFYASPKAFGHQVKDSANHKNVTS